MEGGPGAVGRIVYGARMPRALSDEELRLLRLRAQRLAGGPATSVHEVVRGVGALQAQATRAARLAVRARSERLTAAAVARACNEDRSVVRTWAMRGTLHMLPTEDLGWLVALLGPVFAAAGGRRRRQLGLDEATCERGLAAIAAVLADEGPFSRAELVGRLAAEGVVLDARSQAPAHLVAYAANRGLVCRGPDLDGDEPSYVLLAEWAGEQRELAPEAALAELARRYLAGHGPAGARHFDAYLLGYRGRELVLDPRFARRIQAGGGFVQPALLVDGRVAGTWRQQRRRDRLTVQVEPFEALDRAVLPGLEAEVGDLGRFLGAEATPAVAGG